MMRTRRARYQIFIDLLFLLGIVSISALLLAHLWLNTVQTSTAAYEPSVTPTLMPPLAARKLVPDFSLSPKFESSCRFPHDKLPSNTPNSVFMRAKRRMSTPPAAGYTHHNTFFAGHPRRVSFTGILAVFGAQTA